MTHDGVRCQLPCGNATCLPKGRRLWQVAHGCGRSPAQLCPRAGTRARGWSVTNQELWVDIPTARHLYTSSQGSVHRSQVEKSCLLLRQRLCLKHALKQFCPGGEMMVLHESAVEFAVWQVSDSRRACAIPALNPRSSENLKRREIWRQNSRASKTRRCFWILRIPLWDGSVFHCRSACGLRGALLDAAGVLSTC